MKKLLIFVVLTMVFWAFAANAQVSTFPYNYDWTNPKAFVKQSDGRTYIGGDGNWRTYRVGSKPQWTIDAGAGMVKCNNDNTDDSLSVLVDATGLNFSGGETFVFVAAREAGGGANGTMTITAGTATLVKQIATEMSTSSQLYFLSLPSSLSNSVFSILIAVHSNKQVKVDNTAIFGGALPILLSSFTASAITNKGVTLSWETVSEVNNYGFYVQRDGIDVPGAFVPGHGTTLQRQTYTYTDKSPLSGQHRYRLKQVDLDLTATLSEPVEVDVPSTFALDQNYPNPFNPTTNIQFTIVNRLLTIVKVYDVLGSEVATLVNEVKAPGTYTVQFDGSGLASGVYFYRLKAGTFVETRKFLLLR